MINSMNDRILKIKNIYSEEKLNNLDNRKLLKEINNIYLSSTNEIKLLNDKIKRKLEKENNKINFQQNFPQDKQAQVQIGKLKEDKNNNNANLIIYNETLIERQKEYESIYK